MKRVRGSEMKENVEEMETESEWVSKWGPHTETHARKKGEGEDNKKCEIWLLVSVVSQIEN